MILLFTTQGCPSCKVALPEWEKWKSRNPMYMALQFDADGPYAAQMIGKQIRETPLYALRDGEGVFASHAGAMKAEQLDKWVKAALKALGEEA